MTTARTHLPLKTIRIPTPEARAAAIKATLDDHDSSLDNVEKSGTVPSARLQLATNPTTTNTVTIGGHVFTFIGALGVADTTTQVKILGTAALTRAAFLDAINGVANANVVPATTPHTQPVVADEIDTTRVRLRYAAATGGSPLAAGKAAAAANIAVSETLADASDVWDRTNLNLTGLPDKSKVACTTIAITAAMITAGKVYVEFGFTPLEVVYQTRNAAGLQLDADDAVTIEGNAVKIALAGGAAPNLVATNVVGLVVTG